jgi:hypothetical protein
VKDEIIQMKKIVISFVCLTLLLVSCIPSQPSETPVPVRDPFSIPWEDRSIFKSGLVESQQAILEELDGASVYHIDLNIAEDLYHVSGRQEVQYTNTETVPLDEVHLRLFPNLLGGEMEVSNLMVNDESVTPRLEMNDSLLILPLQAPLEPGSSSIIEMDFDVTVPREVELNYGVLAYFDDVLALAHAYPMIAVYNDEGWNAEIPSQQGDVTFADASFFLVRITAPKDVTVVPSGIVIERAEGGNTQSLLVASGPARDFYLAASPEYEELSQTLGEVTVRSYAPKQMETGSKVALEIAIDSLELFSEQYPDYPYTELDIVATPTLAGGIEYPGNIVVTSRLYDMDSDDPGARQYLEGVVAHEVAHQWFYNLIGDDQLDDPWLDEALAQYLTYEYFTDRYGPAGEEGFRASLENRWAAVNYAEIPIGLPVAAYDGAEYGAIVYGRGPLFFIALRDEIGEEVFNAFLKDYSGQLSWDVATPEFLQSLAEEHCACDLDSMFNEWVYP